MSTNRKVIFANNEFYHIYNRGIEGRPTFSSSWECKRAIEAIRYYQYHNPAIRLSDYLSMEKKQKDIYFQNLNKNEKLIDIIAYCLMPNHFHFLLKQRQENGISKFTSNFTNSYTKYFNAKNERLGPLFQGVFKAVYIENQEQLMHLSRYIHINSVVSHLIKIEELEDYKWSSYRDYIDLTSEGIIDKRLHQKLFPDAEVYKKFVLDHVDYASKLEQIKHLLCE